MVDWNSLVPELENQPDIKDPYTSTDSADRSKSNSRPNLWTKTDFIPKRINSNELRSKDRSFVAIGPIETLEEDRNRVRAIINNLQESNFTLRSGYDKRIPFEMEVLRIYKQHHGKIEFYLPWAKFADQNEVQDPVVKYPVEEAYNHGAYYNPNFNTLKPPVRAIIARLIHQLLGKDLRTPTGMILCYDKYGIDDVERMKYPYTTLGMTLSIAKDAGIPVFNVRRQENVRDLVGYVTAKF